MTILLFIIVLVALILVHEFGHFVVAKLSKMRVDEFGIGYPPRAWRNATPFMNVPLKKQLNPIIWTPTKWLKKL
jgi:membrane-associated protease RseP (regulator of RpoE activity)